MIIDFHTHTFPDQIAAAAIARLSNRCAYSRVLQRHGGRPAAG